VNQTQSSDDPELKLSLAGVPQAHRALAETVAGLTDDQFALPSLLPGWTLAHVVAHISRNADSHARLLHGALRGEVVDQYPGGLAGRTAEIEAVASLPAADLRADLARSSAELEHAYSLAAAAEWSGEARLALGPVVPITELPMRRWREVVVHHHDLGADYSFQQWPHDYVRLDLRRFTMQWASRKPMGFDDLPAPVRAVSDHGQLAWLLGRSVIEGVGPAGLMG
jgi:maleylpyruvate isomerase